MRSVIISVMLFICMMLDSRYSYIAEIIITLSARDILAAVRILFLNVYLHK